MNPTRDLARDLASYVGAYTFGRVVILIADRQERWACDVCNDVGLRAEDFAKHVASAKHAGNVDAQRLEDRRAIAIFIREREREEGNERRL